MTTPTITPVRTTPSPTPEPVRRISPDEICPQQKHEIVRRIERNL